MSPELPHCPHCSARMIPDLDENRLWCQFCGSVRVDAEAQQLLARHRDTAIEEYRALSRMWDMSPIQQRRMEMAWRSIQMGNLSDAHFLLDETSRLYPDCADVWYLLSLTTHDSGQKLMYLQHALDVQPYHEYAWRDKGILEGVLPAGSPPDAAPDPAGPVEAKSETEACPHCGGALAFAVVAEGLVCGHCGYRPGMAAARTTTAYRGGYDKLDNALLQRRFGFSREWKIGARVLVCKNCHAQLTLSGTTFSTQCPFCDSAHILVEDAVGSFEEPDALLPFKIDRSAAAKALHKRTPELRAQVERGEVWGVYLPFWSFEGAASVILPWDTMGGAMSGAFPAGDVLVGGVERPNQAILYELMPYDLRGLIAYDPSFLARWSAQIYNIDVIQASLAARAYIKYAARRQATGCDVPEIELARSDTSAYTPPNTPLWHAAKVEIEVINYRLLLLPVWMITLILRDGMRRPAFVNGQTGEAVLADSFTRPEMIVVGPDRPPIEPLPLVRPTPAPRSHVIRPLPPRGTVIRPLKPR